VRGSPLVRALLAFVALLALAFPLWRLTHATAAPGAAPVLEDSPESAIRLHLTFTSIPQSVKVLHLGREIWHEAAPTAGMEREVALPFPQEGIELEFQVTWSGDTLSAARVILTDPDGEAHERSLWGRSEVTEVLSFP